jgi:hypothetical protein
MPTPLIPSALLSLSPNVEYKMRGREGERERKREREWRKFLGF